MNWIFIIGIVVILVIAKSVHNRFKMRKVLNSFIDHHTEVMKMKKKKHHDTSFEETKIKELKEELKRYGG